jgi:uncharacterized protein DUF929
MAGTAAAAVVAVIAALLIAKAVTGDSDPASTSSPPGSATIELREIAALPLTAFDRVGAGSTSNPPRQVTGAVELSVDGKPEVLYVGAEFCPFCASVTWGLVVALERFGDFSKLDLTTSASDDVYPNTATFTFHKSVYTSEYLTFRGYELSDREHQELDTMVSEDATVFDTYDKPPYTTSAGGIPFLAIGGHYLMHGSTYDPATLEGLNQREITALLGSSTSPVAEAVLSEANLLTAAICASTDNQPAAVCSSAGVTAAAAKLTAGG